MWKPYIGFLGIIIDLRILTTKTKKGGVKMANMTDSEIILNILSGGNWVNVIKIMEIGKPGCINWAVRSRISDLRKKGYNIISEIAENGCAKYKLIKKIEQGVLL